MSVAELGLVPEAIPSPALAFPTIGIRQSRVRRDFLFAKPHEIGLAPVCPLTRPVLASERTGNCRSIPSARAAKSRIPDVDIYTYKYIMGRDLNPTVWMGPTRETVRKFPEPVRRGIGQALYTAQDGGTDPATKPLRGFIGASVMEILERYDTNTFRVVYTSRFSGVIYVLHAFQKKSRKGFATSRKDIDLVKRRLAVARQHEQKMEI